MIAPPLYVIKSLAVDKEKGIQLCKDAIAGIKKKIEEKGGSLVVKMEPGQPQIKTKLEELMEQMELENAEYPGDEND